MGAPSKKPLRGDEMRGTEIRVIVLRLALVAALACVAQPALAKVVMKKGAYGAIALQRDTGQFGYAVDAATSRAAKIEALKQCAHPRCEVVASFNNACGALARGPKKYFPATGAVRPEAETKALRLCAAKECEIIAWACTK
jgi:serine/threonine-protein kinase